MCGVIDRVSARVAYQQVFRSTSRMLLWLVLAWRFSADYFIRLFAFFLFCVVSRRTPGAVAARAARPEMRALQAVGKVAAKRPRVVGNSDL